MRALRKQLKKLRKDTGVTYSRHHRKCRSNNGTDADTNIVLVPKKQHEAWHTLFQNDTVEKIVKKLNDVWIDPECTIMFSWKPKH